MCADTFCACEFLVTKHAYYSFVLGFNAPDVMVTSEGEPTVGNTYTLVCRVSLVEGLVVDPNPSVVWLDSSRRTVSGVNITAGKTIIEGSVVTRNLTFKFLHTSHGGKYTCQASISVLSISIPNLSNSTSTRITVKSMLICYSIRVACALTNGSFHTVPQPTVSITPNHTGVLYAGTPLTLTCSIHLNPAVDTTVMVTRMWRGPGSQVVSNSSHVTVSNLVERFAFLYETTIEFVPLSTSNGGDYECEAIAFPGSGLEFVVNSTTGSNAHSLTIEALPVPEVAIHSTGNTTAGEVYTLSCSATVVENLVVVPTIQWEYSNGSAVDGGSTFTLSAMVVSGNTTTRNLTFSPLRTSHGGEYTCRAIINIPSISITGLSNSQSTDVVVQSKTLGYICWIVPTLIVD